MGSRARKSSIDAICSPLLPLPLSIGSSREIWFAFPEGNRGNERFSSKGGVEYHDLPPYSNSRYPFSLSRHKTLTLQRAWFYEVTEYDSMLRILPPPSFFLRRYAYVLRVCLFALFVLIFSFQIRYSPDEKQQTERWRRKTRLKRFVENNDDRLHNCNVQGVLAIGEAVYLPLVVFLQLRNYLRSSKHEEDSYDKSHTNLYVYA